MGPLILQSLAQNYSVILFLCCGYNLQVFTYNGSVSCSSLEMVIFVVIGFMLVVLFALPVPFGVAYICIKRPIVSARATKCGFYNAMLTLLCPTKLGPTACDG